MHSGMQACSGRTSQYDALPPSSLMPSNTRNTTTSGTGRQTKQGICATVHSMRPSGTHAGSKGCDHATSVLAGIRSSSGTAAGEHPPTACAPGGGSSPQQQ